eukprot:CAMPEP_0194171376 /NCGR_PEP_ID=MMETSP0154-20130528/5960_1 /TAXON_ID=1049557 /ORGANISM="Thalassiothrix antarctica, Strain L6-D1" /LENGTH=266 /DNA_ID=CAMNT_0038883653 /DNA_START=31 /DNA_END=828 /DNA_ORIENTATION=-
MTKGTTENNDDDDGNNNYIEEDSKDDIDWTEHDIHDDDDDNNDTEDKDFMFRMFEPEPEELLDEDAYEYDFDSGEKKVLLRGNRDMNHSTGLAVWTGSEILCDYLVSHSDLVKNKYVLELGSGVGLCGITVAKYLNPSKVVLTDGDKHVLSNLRHNVRRNISSTTNDNDTPCCTNINCPQLIWGNKTKILQTFVDKYDRPDVILASDITYITKSIEPMWQTVKYLLSDGGTFIFIHRSSSQDPVDIVVDLGIQYGFCVDRKEDDGI